MWPYHGFGRGWMMFGGLMMLLFWVVLIVAAILIVRAILSSNTRLRSGSNGSLPSTGNRALEILKERYARGEISKAEYEQMREDLRE